MQAVNVEIGLGSPVPVEVVASADWPDRCAQLAEVHQEPSGNGFSFTVLAGPPQEGCPQDLVGLPMRLALPLNMVEVPPGSYQVEVNGVRTSFDWLEAGPVQRAGAAPESAELRPIPLESVEVQVGVGSPIPADVVVNGTWPDLCAQLAEIRQSFKASNVEISLLATPAEAACPPDRVGLPFRLAIPLNMVEMTAGPYSVTVNGVQTGFDWPGRALPQEDSNPPGQPVAYIGEDGNIWLLGADGETRQVTEDAVAPGADPQAGDTVTYWNISLSPDGSLVAYQRDLTTPGESGLKFSSSLRVYDAASGESRVVDERGPAGLAWKPGSHLLAYGIQLDDRYFGATSEAERAGMATGIWVVDLEQGQPPVPLELVKPERGRTLMWPVWSPDGRLVSFQEIYNLEGCGYFSYYDFEAQKYVPSEDLIGFYSWSPDGAQVAYDRLCYVPGGEERIFLRDRQTGEERQVSPEMEQGYAFRPVISPQGDAVAYLVNKGGPEDVLETLYVQALPDGEPRDLGQFGQVGALNWTRDGQYLVFAAGAFESSQVMALGLADGNVLELARGGNPDLPGP